MALAMVLDSVDDLDDGIKALYIQGDDGKYRPDLEGYEPPEKLKSALDKERANNKVSKKALLELQSKYGDIDLEKALADMAKVKELEEANMLEKGDIDALVISKSKAAMAEKDALISKLETDNLTANSNLRKHVIDAAALNELNLLGVMEPNSISMAINHVGSAFDMDAEGEIVPRSGEFGKDGAKLLTIKEAALNFQTSHPNFYMGSGGAGGKGDGGGHSGSSVSNGDAVAFGLNLEKIASGEVTVK